MSEADVLVLGGSGTGKTHYAGQLLGRLRYNRTGKLKLQPGGVQDLSKLEEVLACLEEGRAAGHTPADTWTGVQCALESSDGKSIVLEWPEYAGERLFSIIKQRTLPSEWRKLINSAEGWMLFIRPTTLQCYEDLLVRPTGLPPEHTSEDEQAAPEQRGWDDQARYVELLQMLIFARAQSTFLKIEKPRLAVVLSCWDERQAKTHSNESEQNKQTNSKGIYTPKNKVEERDPSSVFAEMLPMLESFIRSTWETSAWSIWGLSSLGRALSQNVPDEEFAASGPENFGYVIPPGFIEQDSDLTAPVAWLLQV